MVATGQEILILSWYPVNIWSMDMGSHGSIYRKLFTFILQRFFACCSALCGLLADAEGGTIFRFEDNICTVATYRGLPEAFHDGKASLSSKLIIVALTNMIVLL